MQTEPATRESVVAELMADASPVIEAHAPEAAPVEAAVEQEAPPEGEQQIEAPPEAEDPDAPETASEGEGEEVEAAKPPIEPPHFWSADAKARFAELPYELQLVVQENEKAGSKATTQKLEEASLARKAAEAEAQALAGLTARIEAAAEQAEATFANRWQGMDQAAWLKLSREKPDQYIALKAQYEAEQDAVQRANAAKDASQAVERDRWRNDQIERLKTLQPELVDPVKGQENLTALGSYLIAQGVAEQDLPNVGALEMSVAWKAKLYDELQSLKPTIKAPPKAALRPGAAPPATPSAEREVQTLRNRFAQTGSREDAHALMLAEEKLKR
jgi:hypothetical protein